MTWAFARVDLWLQCCLLGVLHVDTLQNHFPYMSIGDRSVNYVFRTTWIWWWSATGMLLTVIFTTQVKRIWCVWLDTWPGFRIIWIKAKSGLDVSHYKRLSKTVVHTSIAEKSKIFCPDITKKISNATDKSTEYTHTQEQKIVPCVWHSAAKHRKNNKGLSRCRTHNSRKHLSFSLSQP